MSGLSRGAVLAVALLVAVSVGAGFAAATLPADSPDDPTPEFEMDTEDGDNVSDLERSWAGATVDRSLLDERGETVVILAVERNIDTDTLSGDATELLRADSQATLAPVAEEVEALDGATVRNRLWVGNLLSVEIDLDRHDVRELAAIEGVRRVTPNVEFERPDPVETVDSAGEAVSAGGADGAVDTEQDSYDVAVVGSTAQPDSSYGMDYMQSVLAQSLDNSTYSVDAVHPNPDKDHPQNKTILELMDGYDSFVVNTMGGIDSEPILEDFLDNLTANQTVVYLDAYNNGDAIEELSEVRNDPTSASDDFIEDGNTTFVELDVTADHPIFEGLGSAGDSIPVRSVPQADTNFVLYTTFSGYSGEVIADVAPDNGGAFGPGAAVNEENGEVLLPIGQGDSISSWYDEGTQTESAEQLLVNAVQYVTTAVSPPDDDPVDMDVTYGLEQIDIPGFEATFDGERGGNATVAIVDSGLSNPEEGHPDLDIAQKFLVQNGTVTEGLVEVGDHGEHVAGTATGAANPVGDVPRFGVAPEAELLMFDAFGDDPGATFEDIALALEVAAQEGADVGGFSLGAANDEFSESTFEPTFTATVEDANAAGMVVSVSSGNEGIGPAGGQVTSPGTQFDSITVGNANQDRDINPGSSGAVITDETIRTVAGDPVDLPEQSPRSYVKPDVSAAGTGVLSSGPLGGDIGDPAATYSFSTGTSMAQPHIAGAVALLQSVTDEQLPPKQIETALAETAQKPGDAPGGQTERDIRYGTGIINVTAAALALEAGQTVSGTVLGNETGDALVGATVESDSGGLTTARSGGEYTLHPTSDPATVTADAFGFVPETATVTGGASQDFELEPTVAVDLIEDQPSFVVAGQSVEVVVDVANLENISVELTAESDVAAENLTVLLGDQELPLGTTVNLNGSVDGEVALTVETDAGIANGSSFGLVHTFGGEGDSVTVETGPTEVTGEVPPAAFEVTDVSVADTVTTDDLITIVAEIENVGGEAGETETLAAVEGPTVDGEETLVFLPPETVSLDPGESITVPTEFGTVEDINDVIDSVEWGPGNNLTAVQQVGENLNPNEPPEPVIEDEGTAPFSVVEEPIEGPFFEVSNLTAPGQADPGATINVSATITNIGNSSDAQTVEFRFDGSVVATESNVTLDPEENTTVEFDGIQLPTEENNYEHGVFTDNDNQTATITVGQPDPPAFELTNLTQPDKLTVSGDIAAEVEVTNVGGSTGETDILYGTDIDGNFIFIPANVATVQLGPGESTTVSQSLLTFQDINGQLGTSYGPGDDVLTGFQIGENLNPNEPPEPVIEDELTQDISIVEESFFEVSGLTAPAQADPGASINVSATITNTGGIADTGTVEFVFDGQTAASTTVSLNASADTTVEFTPTLPDQPGTYEHGVFTDDDSQTANITVFGPPEVALSALDIAGGGDEVTRTQGSDNVSAELTHTGGGSGIIPMELTIGTETLTKNVSIGIGANVTVTFENATSAIDPGVYDVTMSGGNASVTGSLTLSVDVLDNGEPATDTNGDDLLNDIDGSEEFDIFDIQALFENIENPLLVTNPELFDFNPDEQPEINIFDVQALFEQLSAQG